MNGNGVWKWIAGVLGGIVVVGASWFLTSVNSKMDDAISELQQLNVNFQVLKNEVKHIKDAQDNYIKNGK